MFLADSQCECLGHLKRAFVSRQVTAYQARNTKRYLTSMAYQTIPAKPIDCCGRQRCFCWKKSAGVRLASEGLRVGFACGEIEGSARGGRWNLNECFAGPRMLLDLVRDRA